MGFYSSIQPPIHTEIAMSNQAPLPNSFFKKLTDVDVQEFRQWARKNYVPGSEINGVWHPASRAECELMNLEAVQSR